MYSLMMQSARTICINSQSYQYFTENDPFAPETVDEMWAILDNTFFRNVKKPSS